MCGERKTTELLFRGEYGKYIICFADYEYDFTINEQKLQVVK